MYLPGAGEDEDFYSCDGAVEPGGHEDVSKAGSVEKTLRIRDKG